MPGSIIKTLTTDLGSDGLKPQIRKYINDDRKKYPMLYTQYMNVDTIDEVYVEDMEFGGFSGLPRLDEGDYLNFLSMGVGNKTRYQPDEYQGAFAITRKMKRFNKVRLAERMTRRLKDAARAQEERIAAQPFNLGFSSSFVGSDNQPLFSTAHVNVAGQTVSNRPAVDVDLTTESLEAAITAFATQVGPDGNPIDVPPRYLVVGSANIMNGQRILGADNYFSGAVPAAADTGVASVVKKYNLVLVYNPYLTDPDAWFLLAEKDQHEIQVVRNQPLEDYDFEDPFTRDYVYSLSFAMVAGFSTFLGAYGTTGA